MGPDYKNFIIGNLLTLHKMIKLLIPKVPQLTFSKNYPNLFSLLVRDRVLVINCANIASNKMSNSSIESHCSAIMLNRNYSSFALSNASLESIISTDDQSSTATISGFHLSPKKTKDSFAKLLKS